MTNLEREILDTAAAISAMPDSIERELALRSLRHARSLLDRQLETAVDALTRAKRLVNVANKERKAS